MVVCLHGKFVPTQGTKVPESLQVTERRKMDKYGTDKKSCTT